MRSHCDCELPNTVASSAHLFYSKTNIRWEKGDNISDEQFFSEYKVSEDKKKLFDCLLDILKKFIQVCKDNDLKYYAYAGTLIGAVRHKGFIPWDDDIDIIMLREDYDKFCSIAPKAFTEPYHFQSFHTDYGYVGPPVRIRKSDTTCIKGNMSLLNYDNYNLGIFISIFPLDKAMNPKEAKKRKIKVGLYRRILQVYFGLLKLREPSPELRFLRLSLSKFMKIVKPEVIYKKMINAQLADNDKETDYFCSFSSYNKFKKVIWPKEWHSESLDLDFEDIKISAPVGYDEILRCKYGDYMNPPKSVEEIRYHSVILDTEKSFHYYKENPEVLSEKIANNKRVIK